MSVNRGAHLRRGASGTLEFTAGRSLALVPQAKFSSAAAAAAAAAAVASASRTASVT